MFQKVMLDIGLVTRVLYDLDKHTGFLLICRFIVQSGFQKWTERKKKVATQASTQDGDAPLGVPCLGFTTVKKLQAWIEYELSKVLLYQLLSF